MKPAQKKNITLSLRSLPTELVMSVEKHIYLKPSQRLCFVLQHVRELWFSIILFMGRTGMCAKFILLMVWTHLLTSIHQLVLISNIPNVITCCKPTTTQLCTRLSLRTALISVFFCVWVCLFIPRYDSCRDFYNLATGSLCCPVEMHGVSTQKVKKERNVSL